MCRQSATVCLVKSPTRQHRLILRLETLADPRRRRGKRHPFVSVLMVACSAVLTGARSFAAIGQWASSAPQDTLARLDARTTTVFNVRIAPSAATIRRVLNAACPGGPADLLGHNPAGAETLAVDSKSARGSRHGEIPAAHLLAAVTGVGRVVTQLRVPSKTNEITCFDALLAPYELADVTVTADALHCQREHARFLVEEKKAHYAFTVKRNQKNLHRQLAGLPWEKASAKFYDRATGHGRLETRVVQALTITDLDIDFPHAAQVANIVRHRTQRKTGKRSRETVYVVTDLTSLEASPQRLAKIVHSQWVIENRLHFVRDTTFAEHVPPRRLKILYIEPRASKQLRMPRQRVTLPATGSPGS
ncbi:ISAs1 family transposase [Streptomyces sp. 061-3]|uniref:ISAs1 family transposase n=1 Tax=Streptomyces sp. 061-3 TaxID=2789268 RepID=UPI0039818089